MQRFVSAWLPDLAIERMARIDPAAVPAERPVALVAAGAHGVRITAANAAARAAGICAGMALSDARAGLPGLIARQAEPARDRALLMRLARWAGRYGPARNRQGADGLWIDVTGVAHLFGGEHRLLGDLADRLAAAGFTCRLALADTPGAAHALARHGTEQPAGRSAQHRPRPRQPGPIAPPGEARQALAGLPVEALRLDAATVLLLRRLGLGRIGQLYGLPRAALERRFRSLRAPARGKGGTAEPAAAVLLRLDQALGLVAEPLAALGEPPVLSVRRIYSEPVAAPAWLAAETAGLAGELAAALAASGLGARRVRLGLHRADGTVAEAGAGFATACRDGPHICRLLTEKLERLDAGLGLDVLVLDAESVEPLAARQEALGQHAAGRARAAVPLIDRLANRLGPSRVTVLEARMSHMPERAQVRMPALAHAAPAQSPCWPAALTRPGSRPAFLLARPEPITVTAEIPEGPPARFIWRRVMRLVRKAEGPERIAPEWWRDLHLLAPPQSPGGGRSSFPPGDDDRLDRKERDTSPSCSAPSRPRDYYRLEDGEGGRYWVFREGLYGACAASGAPAWYLHGVLA